VNIDWIIPCRYVEVNGNLGTIVGAGIDIFYVQDLPQPIAGMLAIRLTGTSDEFDPDVKHEIRSKLLKPSGEELGEIKGEFQAGGEDLQEDWLNPLLLPSGFQFVAEEEGTYTIEQHVDQAEKSIPIHVIKGLPGAPT
jgi:Family of unknown function (DUF6941)